LKAEKVETKEKRTDKKSGRANGTKADKKGGLRNKNQMGAVGGKLSYVD